MFFGILLRKQKKFRTLRVMVIVFSLLLLGGLIILL